MKLPLIFVALVAVVYCYDYVGDVVVVSGDTTIKGTLKAPTSHDECMNYNPHNYAFYYPVNTKAYSISTSVGNYYPQIYFNSLGCPWSNSSFMCILDSDDIPASYFAAGSTFSFPDDAPGMYPHGNWIYMAASYSGSCDEPVDVPYTFDFTFEYCAEGKVFDPYNDVCASYYNGTFGQQVTYKVGNPTFFRYEVPQGVAQLVITLYDTKGEGVTIYYHENYPKMFDYSWPYDQYDPESESLPWSMDSTLYLPKSGDAWFSMQGANTNVTFEVTALTCPEGTGGLNCTSTLVDLRTLKGTYHGTVDASDDYCYPMVLFYIDFDPKETVGYEIEFTSSSSEVYAVYRKNGYPIVCDLFTIYDHNVEPDENGRFFLTPWDSFVGGRVYMGVYTEASTHKTFTVSVKQNTFASPGQSRTTAGESSAFVVVPSMLLMVIACCLFFVM